MKKTIALFVFLSWQSTLYSQQKYQSLQEALFSAGKLYGSNGPESVNWINGGEKFSFLEESGQIKAFTPLTAKEEVIFDASQVTFPNTKTPFEYESFQWSKDFRYILFKTNFRPVWRNSGISDYYFYTLSTKSMKLVAKDAQSAEVSPDGKRIGYEKGGNLFAFDFLTQKEAQLTNDAQADIYNGRFGWAYEEEFGLAQAWVWSPDSRYIAFWQTDEREVPIFQMTDYAGLDDDYVKIKYPKVGDKNPQVKIGIVEVNTKKRQWMQVNLNDGYIPRIYWTSKTGTLAMVHFNRAQNHLQLFFGEAATGNTRLVMEEKNNAWIDVFDFFAGIQHYFFFPETDDEFFWISDRDGWNHIYRYDYQGKLLNQVTQGTWEVVIVHQVDVRKKMIYYSSTEKSPLERQLYAVSFDGKKKLPLTKTEGRHFIDMSPNGDFYIDRYSNVTTPTKVELWDTQGKKLKNFTENPEVDAFLKERNYAPRQLMSFIASDGQKLDIYVVKPLNFNPAQKYPVVLSIYGGPGAQSVYNEFGKDGWEQYLAQEGYVVVSVNNRGSGGYGAKFRKTVYANLGEWESKDFVETAKYMGSLPWTDKNRMAIYGHSYGGYMSSYTMLKYPDTFKVALVTAPVTDFRLYDSIYAERYMGLLPQNDANYVKSAPLTYAGNLKGKMLLTHATMDENVHVQNTFQLVKAFIDKGKDVDLRIYPPGAHGVAYNAPSYVLLYTQYTEYLNRYLK